MSNFKEGTNGGVGMSQDNKSSQCAIEGRPHGFGEIWRRGEAQQEKETVRRVVACVSACRGYSTEELESANLCRESVALLKQRDELLDTMRELIRWVPVYPKAADGIVGGRAAYQRALDNAKAAIAKSGGES